MQIYVINLEKDADRRAAITDRLHALGLPFELVAGIYGAALSPEERALHYDDGRAKWRMARSLVPAEIGCALSHVKIYREMIARRVPCALILEDDVSLPGELEQFLWECSRVLDPRRPEVWLLSPATGRTATRRERALGLGRDLLPYAGGYFTSSYILTLAAATALLAELYPIADVADCWQRLDRHGVVDLFVVSPPLIVQDQERFGSSTTSDYHTAVGESLGDRLVYKLRRVRNIVADIVYAHYRRWRHPTLKIKALL